MTDRAAEGPPTVNDVVRHIVAGHMVADIVELLSAEGVKQPDKMIAEAVEIVLKEKETALDDRLAFAIAAARHVHQKMIEVGDYAGAVNALKAMVAFAKELQTHAGGARSPIADHSGRLRLVGR